MPDLFLGGAIDPATQERSTGGATTHVHVPTDDLTTHGVIVGMTGSGKTGLGIVMIEEALRAGVPVIAIDPKGDLTNLCLTFPSLTGSDFLPWVDPAQARNSDTSVEDFADHQATQWTTGLAAWGLGGDDIRELRDAADVTIYTPGSEAGCPVNIVGSLQVPPDLDTEVVADEIEGHVTGLLGLVGIEADPLSSREHILLSNLIDHAWSAGRNLDLMTLVGMIGSPPMRKLGVFDLDEFYPRDDRMELAMRLNGLLAAPSFAAWTSGEPLDVGAMLHSADGSPRCSIITTSHLSDEERQFVTSLVLSKLVTWMRRQSGTTDLRALVYMDEVAGYLPPTEKPPTKKPIMLLMKQARAFGVGVVLSTQNPVDIDYKAISNAGTWMIGRLQTEQDRNRLLDGMASAAGTVDVATVEDTISGLGSREFVLRRAGSDRPELMTTRWAMSYLRGPMTRDQIERVMEGRKHPSGPEVSAPDPATGSRDSDAADPPVLADDESVVMPDVADGVAVRWVDVAAPWLTRAGGDSSATTFTPVAVARVAMRYDERRADLVHDDEFECVVALSDDMPDVADMLSVDYDDRDLRDAPAATSDAPVFRLPSAKISTATFWRNIERDIRNHLVQTMTVDVVINKALKVYGRPGEPTESVAERCRTAADDRADADIAKLRDKYEVKAKRLRDRIEEAHDRLDVLEEQAASRRNSELLSTAGSVIGGLLGGRKSVGGLVESLLGQAGTAARRRGSTPAAAERVDAQENKIARLLADAEDLEADLADDIMGIQEKWSDTAATTETITVGLEKSDVAVTDIALAWLPSR